MRLNLSAITTILRAAWENRTPVPSMASWYNNHYTNAAKFYNHRLVEHPRLTILSVRTKLNCDTILSSKTIYYIYNFVPPQGFEPWPADSCSDMLIHYTIEAFERLVGFEPTMNYWFCRPMASTTHPQVHICWDIRTRTWTKGTKIPGAAITPYLNIQAGVERLELSPTVLETGMLPLHHTPIIF